jgi:hypothetical protein
MHDLAQRIDGQPMVSTDGHQTYPWAVYSAFRGKVDHAVVTKTYSTQEVSAGRYSPPVCTGQKTSAACGSPDLDKASTSHVERQNLTMRMACAGSRDSPTLLQEGGEP